MEREAIINNTLDLPPIEVGQDAKDGEIWDYTDGDAHVKVARECMTKRGLEFYQMAVAGPDLERNRIIMEFIEALGSPTEYGQRFDVKEGHIDSLSWLIKPKLQTPS